MLSLFIVVYAAGLLLGSLSVIEWLVKRIARLLLADRPKRARIAR